MTDRAADKTIRYLERKLKRVESMALRSEELAERTRAMTLRTLEALSEEVEDRKKKEVALASALEQAESATRAKNTFLATMSHEIRTPMTGLLGMLEILRDTRLDVEQKDFVETAIGSAASLLRLLDDVLDFARIEGGHVRVRPAPVWIHDAVDDVCAVLAQTGLDKGLVIWVGIDPATPAQLELDPLHLRQILTNLLSNAIKFTDRGEVSVEARYDADAQKLEVTVSDTGIGIPAESFDTIFAPFTQVDGSRTRRHMGTGLGLAIVRQILTLHGGELELHSEVGRGSRFTFSLPAPITRADYPADRRLERARVGFCGRQAIYDRSLRNILATLGSASSATGAVGLFGIEEALDALDAGELDVLMAEPQTLGLHEARVVAHAERIVMVTRHAVTRPLTGGRAVAHIALPLRRRQVANALERALRRPDAPRRLDAAHAATVNASRARVLVVEDNEVNRFIAKRLVERAGYTCETVSNGAEALVALGRGFDIILMDCHMPVLDGYSASLKIRAMEHLSPQPVIIAMTANSMAEEREQCAQAGMDDFLPKPLDPARLARALDHYATERETAHSRAG